MKEARHWRLATWVLASALLMGLAASAGVWPAKKVPPDKLIDPAAPALGPEKATAVIVEFADFECPYCAEMSAYIEELRLAAPADVRVVWMDRPLARIMDDGYPFHPYSMLAHEAAGEAQAQGKFWEMERAIFTAQASLFPFGRPRDQAEYAAQLEAVKNKLTAMSAELNLDKKKMEQALSDHCRQAALEKRAEMADKLKINGTPTVYVNGVEAGPDQSEVRRAVEKALGREILPGPR